MPMRIAALGVLVELDCKVHPDQIAKSFNHDSETIEDWFDDLVRMGYAEKTDGLYKATEAGRNQIYSVIKSAAIVT